VKPPAHRARSSPYQMISFDDAYNTVIEHTFRNPVIHVDVSSLKSGMVIAKDVYALENVPAYPASIVDGYAVIGTLFLNQIPTVLARFPSLPQHL
jgi:gephyrin